MMTEALQSFGLIVLAAIVLAPMLALFGFTGCQLVFQAEPGVPTFAETFETAFTEQKNRPNRTIVTRIEPVRLSRSGSRVRVVLQRPLNGDLNIRLLSISHAGEGGDPYDADIAPTTVTEALLLTAEDPADPNDDLIELDSVNFNLDHTKPLLIAIDIGDSGRVRHAENVPATDGRSFVGPQDVFEAAVTDRSPNYESEDRIYLVKRIDVEV